MEYFTPKSMSYSTDSGLCLHNDSYRLLNFQLQLNNGVLRVEVNIDALDLSSTPRAQVFGSLQQHITTLQVKRVHSLLI